MAIVNFLAPRESYLPNRLIAGEPDSRTVKLSARNPLNPSWSAKESMPAAEFL
ncbi:hypothetical protein [Aquabacterium sp.]|uniref:hypothetical protein n=1 Tax=Aquabacterium sp. TaxID=1872578 RepID=UPI002CBE1D65|nr:hypothetical protein [Aquabacterium sp.]HSW03795.1 hypothetical protein [Aquabacterium sp.]